MRYTVKCTEFCADPVTITCFCDENLKVFQFKIKLIVTLRLQLLHAWILVKIIKQIKCVTSKVAPGHF